MALLHDPAHAIREKALECVDLFDAIEGKYDRKILSRQISPEAYSHDPETKHPFTFLSTRDDFDFWTYFNGVISTKPSSLDFEPEGSDIHARLLLDYLGIIWKALASLYSPCTKPSDDLTEFIKTFENAAAGLHIVVRRLYGVAKNIRALWAKHVDQTRRATFFAFTIEDTVFQDYITHLIRHRFPAAGSQLHTTLGESIAVRRRRLLSMNKHLDAKRTTIRLAPSHSPLVAKHDEEILPDAPLYAGLPIQQRAPHGPEGPLGGISEAVRPDASDEGLGSMQLPKTQAVPRMISTVHFSNDESFEYPPTPVLAEGQTEIQCPFCSDELELGSDANKAWKDHIHQDLMPYPCLLPECSDALRFFATRKEWKTHMKTKHDPDWVYKVSPNWYCRLDHEPQSFNTELEWRSHLRDPKNHNFKRQPREAELRLLTSRMNRIVPYAEFLCPLCKKFPENTEHLLGKDDTSRQLINNLMLDHIADHLESLSLKALPSLQHPELNDQGIPRLPSRETAGCRTPSPEEATYRTPSPEETTYGTPSPDDMERLSPKTDDSWDTEDEFFPRQCQCCGSIHIEGAIPLRMIRRFLTADDIDFAKSGKGNSYLKTCPCCGEKSKKRAFSPDTGDWPLDDTASVVSNQRAPYDKEYSGHRHPQVDTAGIEPSWFNLWVSWQQRHNSLRHRRIDPILMRLARSSRADLRQVADPETWSSNFPRDVRQERLVAVAPAVARTGNVWAARRLISSGFNVDMVDEDGMSPLLWAAVQGHEEMVRLLLENKAEIEKHDKAFKRTPLSLAALGGHKAVVDLLLNAGANVHSSDSSRRTSLFWAVVGGHISVVQSLVAFGARYQDPDRIFFMPYSRDEESADEKYSSRTVFRPMSLIDSAKMECFTSAIEKGDEKAVCELLDQDHDIHGFNIDSKKTILDFAIESRNWAIIQMLFQQDAERVQPGSVTMVSRLLKVYKGNDGASSVVG